MKTHPFEVGNYTNFFCSSVDEARMYCFCLGDGWRLPTANELYYMQHEDLYDPDTYCWSCSKTVTKESGFWYDEEPFYAANETVSLDTFNSIDDYVVYNFKYYKFYKCIYDKAAVIPVRTI